MKSILPFLKSSAAFYVITTIVILGLNYIPPLYHNAITPENRSYTGTVFYSDDYSYYVSVIQQGMDGNWMVLDKYTSEPHEGTFMHFHYLLLGKIGNIFHLSSIFTYHLSRFILGCIFLLLIFKFIKQFLPNKLQKLAFLLIVFSTTWPKIIPSGQNGLFNIIPMFNEPNPVVRFATQPHFQIGAIFTLITLMIFSKIEVYSKKPVIIILYILFAFYCALTDPAQSLTILSGIALFLGWNFFKMIMRHSSMTTVKSLVLLYIPTVVASIIPFLYLRTIRNEEPWKTISQFDTIQNFPFSLNEFILAFGPGVLFSLFGMYALWKNSHQKNPNEDQLSSTKRISIVLACWVIAESILIFILSNPLSINRLRMFHSPLFIAFGFFAVFGIDIVAKKISGIFQRKIYSIVVGISMGVIMIIGIPLIIIEFKEQMDFLKETGSALIYPPKTHGEAFKFLKENSNRKDVILCMYEACNQIPYFSGNTVFIGNITGTLNESYKSRLTQEIFNGHLKVEELKKTLITNNIKYLFVGYQEAQWQIDFSKYYFLKKVFSNSGASIWKVI